MLINEKQITATVRRILRESLFSDQWEHEIDIFFNRLENSRAFVGNGTVAVEWGSGRNDPRFICYHEGEWTLTDDHFSQQHSRRLSEKELKEIYYTVRDKYGMEIKIPEECWYDNETQYYQ